MITGLHHVNILIPPSSQEGPNSLALANAFYGQTLGLTPRPVPLTQKDRLAWFDIGTSGQQVHVAFGRLETDFTSSARQATRHLCFRVENVEKLLELQERIWWHFLAGQGRDQQDAEAECEKGEGEKTEEERRIRKASAPMECDQPGKESSGEKGPEYPTRFFARDFSGNRLEFTV